MNKSALRNRIRVGIFGSAAKVNTAIKQKARRIGKEIAQRNGIVVTGGCGGLPYEAAKAAHKENGFTIGISPARTKKEHVDKLKMPSEPYFLIFTGAGKKGRNLININNCHSWIFIGGRAGTINEFTIAYDQAQNGQVIGILKGSGTAADEVLPKIPELGKSTEAELVLRSNPSMLVEEVFNGILLKEVLE